MSDTAITRDLAQRYVDRDQLDLDVALGVMTATEADRLSGEARVWLIVNGEES